MNRKANIDFLQLLDTVIGIIGDDQPYIIIRDPEVAAWWISKYGDGSIEHPFKSGMVVTHRSRRLGKYKKKPA